MSTAELLDTFHASVALCSRKSYKKNVNKSSIVAYLVQQNFLWQTYLSFEEIFDIPFSFLHLILRFFYFILDFHNKSTRFHNNEIFLGCNSPKQVNRVFYRNHLIRVCALRFYDIIYTNSCCRQLPVVFA